MDYFEEIKKLVDQYRDAPTSDRNEDAIKRAMEWLTDEVARLRIENMKLKVDLERLHRLDDDINRENFRKARNAHRSS